MCGWNIVEGQGGAATTGSQSILDVEPEELHQRCSIVIGNKQEVELYEKMASGHFVPST